MLAMRARLPILMMAAALLAAGESHAAVFKCRDTNGSLTYQEFPCAGADEAMKNAIASEFPPPNVMERERTLQREADLYRRLEAERDRLSAETIARLARPDPVPIPVEASGGILWPAWSGAYSAARWPQRPQPRNAMRDWAHGRLR